jgi:hypothetical protein
MQNRVHRRVIVLNDGEALYKASSRAALLAALMGYVEGHVFRHTQASMQSEFLLEENHSPLGMNVMVDATDTDTLTREVRSLAWMVTRGWIRTKWQGTG